VFLVLRVYKVFKALLAPQVLKVFKVMLGLKALLVL
jgi:hypothetical protein